MKISNLIFLTFKKVLREFLALTCIICVSFLGLTIITYYLYGQYLEDYQNFTSSLIMNLKLFILNENFESVLKFLKVNKSLANTIIIITIFLLRYFLMNLYYPIYIEYLRIESENLLNDKEEISQSKTNYCNSN